ncbi:MAG: hypothetical protein PHD01_05395 [Geobacteraceae bacterium]|nr:hypothetical protein [Geobacteraceae bacterium]
MGPQNCKKMVKVFNGTESSLGFSGSEGKMIFKYVRVIAIIVFGIMLSATVGADSQLDGVLGIPWGSSTEQARQIMGANGNTFANKFTHPESGTPILLFKGSYAGYPAEFRLHFMSGQMWKVETSVWESDIPGRLNHAFVDINKLLTEKYGPLSRDESHNSPDRSLAKPVMITQYEWSLGGNAKKIELSKAETYYIKGYKMEGNVSVSYENIQLYEILKKKNI